jgi:D-xylose transport system substrate-binding protein
MTVYKAVKKEADAASSLAIALIKNQDTSSIINGSVKDTVLNKDVPSALQTPVSIFKANVKDVIDDGYQKASDVCTAQFASACQAAGIS